jgi:leucyl-tRNA synthetase
VTEAPWPKADPAMLVDDTVTLPIQINGKRRAEITVPRDARRPRLKSALADDAVICGRCRGAPKKLIVVPGRIVNVVV